MSLLRRLKNLWALSSYRVERPRVGDVVSLVPTLKDDTKPKKKPAVIVNTADINPFDDEHAKTS